MEFDKKVYRRLFEECIREKRIKKSQESFKIKLFLEKAENLLDDGSQKLLTILFFDIYWN